MTNASGLDHLAARASNSLLAFLASPLPESVVRAVGPVHSVRSGSGLSGINIVVVTGSPMPLEASIADEIRRLEAPVGGLQVAFRCSGRPGRRFRRTVERLNLVPLTEQKAMVLDRPGPLPDIERGDLTITEVHDDDALGAHLRTMASSFGMDQANAGHLFRSELLLEPQFRFFNGIIEGRVVATAAVLLTEGSAAINNVGVLGPWRRKGLATAMTVAAMRWAADNNTERYVLDATPSGEGIYRRLGFDVVDTVRFYRGKVLR